MPSKAAFHELQEATTRLIDPSDVTEECPSILANVLDRMDGQVAAFSFALDQHMERPTDNEIYNELLRIAYNFADGARSFLDLIAGICDLKPIISWLTVFEQVDLAHRFGQLPFSMVGKVKPSLDRYRSVDPDGEESHGG